MCMLSMGRYVQVYVGYVHVYVGYREVCTCGLFLYSWLSSYMHVTYYTTVGQLV